MRYHLSSFMRIIKMSYPKIIEKKNYRSENTIQIYQEVNKLKKEKY